MQQDDEDGEVIPLPPVDATPEPEVPEAGPAPEVPPAQAPEPEPAPAPVPVPEPEPVGPQPPSFSPPGLPLPPLPVPIYIPPVPIVLPPVLAPIAGPVSELADKLRQLLDDIAARIAAEAGQTESVLSNAIEDIGEEVGTLAGGIVEAITEQVGSIGTVVGGIAGTITERIAEIVAQAAATPGELLTGVLTGLLAFTEAFASGLIPADELFDRLFGSLTGWVLESDNPLSDLLRSSLLPALAEWASVVDPKQIDSLTASLNAIIPQSPGPQVPTDILTRINELPGPIRLLVQLVTFPLMVHTILSSMFVGHQALWTQVSLAGTLPTVPSPDAIATWEILQDRDHPERADIASRAGLDPRWLETLREARQPPLQTEIVLELLRREALGDIDAVEELRKQGYTTERAMALMNLQLRFPGPDDIVRFLVRDVFDPEAVERGSLDEDFTEKFSPLWFGRAGLDEELARFYWRAHWQLPSPTQLYEMLHRRLIEPADVEVALKQADWAPAWVQHLMAVSFNPLTRVDVRRMHKLGVLNDEEMTSAYQDIGYTRENAERLAEFTRRLNNKENAEAIEPFRASLKGRVVAAYIDRLMPEDQAREALTNLGYTEDQRDAFIAEAEFERAARIAGIVRNGVHKAYVSGVWDERLARDRLVTAGIDPEDARDLLTVWALEREYRELSTEAREARDLTKTEILSAYKEGIIPPADAAEALVALHYDEQEIATLIALTNVQRTRAESTARREAVRALYVASRISRLEAIGRLDQLAVTTAHRDALLDRWDVDRETREPELSTLQLEQLIAHELMTDADATLELRAHGYTPRRIELLLQLWGSKEAAARAKERAATEKRERDLSTREIQQAYIAELLTEAQATTRLLALGYDDDEARVLLALTTRELSIREATNLWAAGSLTETQLRTRLRRLGYSADDTDALLTLITEAYSDKS